jgi:dienelactone hydrolase
MESSAVHRPHAEAPASAGLVPCPVPAAWSGLHAQRFEIVSRGDFVPGVLYASEDLRSELRSRDSATTSAPLLLIAHDARGSSRSDVLAWARAGLRVAAIDLPLHGSRRSAKLSERLCEGFDRVARAEALEPETQLLMEEFARQSTSDLIRTLDALVAAQGAKIDADRIGFLGFGLGAIVGSYLLAHDPRPRIAVLAGASAGVGPPELDPVHWISRASKVECLVVAAAQENEHGDEPRPSAGARALADAVPGPHRLTLQDGDPRAPSAETVARIRDFLSSALGF